MPFPWWWLHLAPQQRAVTGQPVTGGTSSPKTRRQNPGEQVPHCPQHPTAWEGSEELPHTQSPGESGAWGTSVAASSSGCC